MLYRDIIAVCSEIHTKHIYLYRRKVLGEFAKLRKRGQLATSCLSVHRPSARMGKPAPTRRIFLKFDIWVFFEKLSENSSLIKIGQG